MSNLTHFDGFSIEPVTEMFHVLFRPLRSMIGDDAALADMKIDVTESDAAYQVKAELPGVDKKDIDVKIDGSRVSINATVERNRQTKEGERVICRERYTGVINRSFSLANDIDEAGASAQYHDGVLSLTLPKKTTAGSKRLQIN